MAINPECWEELSLAELRKSIVCGKRDFGPFVEKTEDQSIIFSPRLSYMLY
jgi:hypothetical protein